jgi:methenyltetrahydromethanopterin cyclohydrolase
MDPSQKAAEVDKLLQEMDQAVKSAPAEIRSDFNTIAQTMRPFFDQLKKADYDYTKVDLSALMTAFSSPALATAIQHIGDYAKTRCGIDVTSTTR